MTPAQIETPNAAVSELGTIIALLKQLYEERPVFGSTTLVAVYHDGRLQNVKTGREISYLPAPEYQTS